MQAIEFEATVEQHTIRVPDHIPDGVTVRVLLLLEDTATPIPTGEQWREEQFQKRKTDYLTMKVDKIIMPSREMSISNNTDKL